MPGHRRDGGRWVAHPRRAAAVRFVVFLLPVLTSFVAAWALIAVLPPSHGVINKLLDLLLLVVVSTVVLVVIDRAARRLLPLATLLDLSLLFPEVAPSRLALARDAMRRRPIQDQLARVRDAGVDPAIAAREILSLVAALSQHDRPTRGHAERVRMFTDLIAAEMRIPERDRDLLRWAAILHDIGKLRIPSRLLNKPGKPDAGEWAALRAHPQHGAEIAQALLPWLGEWGQVIIQHHERWDGTGYPRGLAGEQIHVGARIVAVADAFDVMTATRAYRRPVSRAAAFQELIRFAGTQFDPTAVRALVSQSAPRVRRAQGMLAYAANIPLVASSAVPVTTLTRVVGAAAISTGAVTGMTPAAALAPTAVVAHASEELAFVERVSAEPPAKAEPTKVKKAKKAKKVQKAKVQKAERLKPPKRRSSGGEGTGRKKSGSADVDPMPDAEVLVPEEPLPAEDGSAPADLEATAVPEPQPTST